MASIREGSIHLFRFAKVDVFLHWSWFFVAIYELQGRQGNYSAFYWNVLEYLALFVIVLIHEFGHALACRQVGGVANQIVLWPLGGVAYVNPPPRPGATLWSIAAGPLVNVALVPIISLIGIVFRNLDLWRFLPDAHTWLRAVSVINLSLLIFNLLPIYPLDGGQIFRSLLWFVLGRARSLMVAASVGFIGAIGFVALALWQQSLWIGAIAAFVLLNCWNGWQQARALSKMAKLPRRDGYACPRCKSAPPLGEFWKCSNCQQGFDTFESGGTCPHCGAQFGVTSCLDCGMASPIGQWGAAAVAPHGL